jgi:ribosomal protein L40E
MIICPNCEHQNPDGATLCETCYTPLPVNVIKKNDSNCPHCGAEVPLQATFCGQCGSNLILSSENQPDLDAEKQVATIVEPAEVPLVEESMADNEDSIAQMRESSESSSANLDIEVLLNQASFSNNLDHNQTQLQIQKATLHHIQTDTKIDLPTHLAVIHLGKPNDKVPPDIDVSGFPYSQIVSRIHADILQEADAFYLEDTGSANGTYINHSPLPTGNRHRLRNGDRIALGKEDKVSFIFQLNQEE